MILTTVLHAVMLSTHSTTESDKSIDIYISMLDREIKRIYFILLYYENDILTLTYKYIFAKTLLFATLRVFTSP